MQKLMTLAWTGLIASSAQAAVPPPPAADRAPSAAAATSPAPAGLPANSTMVVAGGGGQGALAVSLTGNQLYYRACDRTVACTTSVGDRALTVPPAVPPSEVKLEVLAIGADRRVLWAHAPGWSALLGAAPGGSEGRVLWQGATGAVQGEAGELHGSELQVIAGEGDEPTRVLVGEVREDVTICGRVSLLAPKVLDPSDFQWKSVTVQRLARGERDRALALGAHAVASPVTTAGLLQATGASSGTGSPGALTDGNPDTTWAENRGGDGRGEFVQFRAPEPVPLTGLSFVVRPPHNASPHGAAPRRLWLATPDQLFEVTFLENAWTRPGVAFEVSFPKPLKTGCLAVVLEQGFEQERVSEVTLAEVAARTELDGAGDVSSIALALAGGGARGETAAAVLSRTGDVGFRAVIDAYPRLDDVGRRLALAVLDGAPCAQSAPIYVQALAASEPAEAQHGSDRLLRCGRDGAPALEQALTVGSGPARLKAAQVLALTAPDLAIAGTVPWLGHARPALRAELRAVLTRAAASKTAQGELAKQFADPKLPVVATVDLLRAASAGGAPLPAEATQALTRLARPDADFRTRYLLLVPAAAAASAGDRSASDFVIGALSRDPDAHVRARAAEAAGQWPAAWDALVAALGQADPRVREAVLASLSRLAPARAALWSRELTQAILRVAKDDPFTFVRLRGADALGAAPPAADADAALGAVLDDASPAVRARAADWLGTRGAIALAKALRARLSDDDSPQVRAGVARALGAMCDRDAIDPLTLAARLGAARSDSGGGVAIAVSAAQALGRLYPSDLTTRLAPLLAKSSPAPLQQAARAAVAATQERCPSATRVAHP